MSISTSSISRVRHLVAAGAFGAVLVLGAGTAAAQDEHSGGVGGVDVPTDPGVPGDPGGSGARSTSLPITGSDVAGLVGIGAAAIAIGSGAVAVSKRRTRLS